MFFLNLYMNGVVREVQARTLERRVQLVRDGKEKWEVSQLLFTDDTVLVADRKKKVCRRKKFGKVCSRRKLKVNVAKSKGSIPFYNRYDISIWCSYVPSFRLRENWSFIKNSCVSFTMK